MTTKYYYDLCKCYPKPGGHPPPYLRVSALEAAAAKGCAICSVVKAGLAAVLDGALDPEYRFVFKLTSVGELRISYMRDKEWGTRRKFEMYLARDQPNLPKPMDNMSNFREVHADPISKDCLERVKQMIQLCDQHHPQCHPSVSASLPLRVIDVGTSGSDPRLHVTQGEAANYIALSHCWGSDQNLTTKRATLPERLRGIGWDTLPKTFQDAITITRMLGVKYIWIDSLCIIQDDSQDWETQSMKMDEIFQNSFLTVAASLSSSDSDGFIRPRTKYVSEDVFVKNTVFPGGSAKFRVRLALGKHQRHDVGSKIRDSYRANLIGPAGQVQALEYRAWAFQERLVPYRILSYCSNEVEWDCVGCCDCECGERFRDFEKDGWDFRNGSGRQVYQALKELGHEIPREDTELSLRWKKHIYEQWRTNLVPSYTQLKLTEEKDRLPALSAVVKGLEDILQDTYLGGLWRSDLELGLTWIAGAYGTSPPNPGCLPEKYRAPSWSWASIEGPVDVCYDGGRDQDDFEPIVQIVDVGTTLAGINPRGDVSDGFVKLSGYLVVGFLSVPEVLQGTDEHNVKYSLQIDGGEAFFRPDTPLVQHQSMIQRSKVHHGDMRESISCPVQCLAVLMARIRHNTGFMDNTNLPTTDFTADRWVTFLVLGPSSTKVGSYERLGIVKSMPTKSLSDRWYEKWPKVEVTIV